jgi:hypothetical protein
MIGTLGMGSPAAQFGQPGPSPYGGYPIAAPFGLQTPYLQSLQQLPISYGMTAHGPYAQAQGLPQILPQQLVQLNQLLQHQVQGLQQLLQIVPQQLHHIQQLLQLLPQQIHQLQLQTQQQPFGTQAAGFGAQWQQPIGGALSWGQPTTGVNIGSPAFGGQQGPVM